MPERQLMMQCWYYDYIIINAVSECHDRLCKPCIQCQCCWQISASMCFSPAIPCYAIPIFPKQNTMRRSLPAEKRLTLDWRKARHLWLKNTMESKRLGWDFPDAECRNAVCMPDLHDVACRASWWCLDLILSLVDLVAWSTYECWHDLKWNQMAWRYCFGPDTWIGTMGRSRTTWHQKQTAKCHCAGDRWQLSFPSTFLQHGEDMKS